MRSLWFEISVLIVQNEFHTETEVLGNSDLQLLCDSAWSEK